MATLGTGVIILLVFWIIAIISLALFTFVQSPIKYVGLIMVVIAAILTLVLGLLPRGDAESTIRTVPYNSVALYRILILTFLCVTFVVGLVLIFIFEVMQPVYAQPIQKRYVN